MKMRRATSGYLTQEPPVGDTCLSWKGSVASPGAPPEDTCPSRKGSGGSPGSPSRGHVSLPEGLRWAHPGAPTEDTRLNRKRKENKRKGKSYYRRFLRTTTSSGGVLPTGILKNR